MILDDVRKISRQKGVKTAKHEEGSNHQGNPDVRRLSMSEQSDTNTCFAPINPAASSVDNLLPPAIALKAENVGVLKANLDLFTLLTLSILAGAFISLGSIFFTAVVAGNGVGGSLKLPVGILRLAGGTVFSLGLILVVIAGAELFTGNILIIMAAASKKISIRLVARNWGMAYVGNMIGAIATAYLVFASGHYKLADGIIGLQALAIASAKCKMPFMEALISGIYCNALVCLAVWLCLSGRTVIDKIGSIIFPIAAFVTIGFEHCVANMYFIPTGIFIKNYAEPGFWIKTGNIAGNLGSAYESLTWSNFFVANLLPVSLGNIIGGLMVGLMYWIIYNRPNTLNFDNQMELLKKLIVVGRRKHIRYTAEGHVTLHSDSCFARGKLFNISEGGLLCAINKQETYLPCKLEKIMCDIESNMEAGTTITDHKPDKIKISGINALVVNLGSEMFSQMTLVWVSIKFINLTQEKKKEILDFIKAIPDKDKQNGKN